MPIVNGVKMSCDVCLRGHRGSICPHTDRQLHPVKPKGRPAKRAKAPGDDKAATSPTQTTSTTIRKIRKPTAGTHEIKCCTTADCRCVHLQGELIESAGCTCCGPGLAQQDFGSVQSDLAAHQAISPPLLASSSSSMSASSMTSNSSAVSQSSSYPRLDVKSEPPFSPPLSSVQAPREPFELDLPCTCEDSCPCPGCPSHRYEGGGKRKRSPTKPMENSPTHRNVDNDDAVDGCCSSGSRLATKVSSQHCQGCLPCIIAPFERAEPPPPPPQTLPPRSRSGSNTSFFGLDPNTPIEAMNRTLPPLAKSVTSPRTSSSGSSPSLPYPPSLDEPMRRSTWFRSQMGNGTGSNQTPAASGETWVLGDGEKRGSIGTTDSVRTEE